MRIFAALNRVVTRQSNEINHAALAKLVRHGLEGGIADGLGLVQRRAELVDDRCIVLHAGGTQASRLIGGNIQVIFENVAAATPCVKSDRVRALSVTGRSRVPNLPDIAPIAESGLPD